MHIRLAVFTSQFPGRVSTFFARDVRALLDAGIEVDIFPIYPIDSGLWKYVPDILCSDILPRDRVRYINPVLGLSGLKWLFKQPGILTSDIVAILQSAMKYGLNPFAKSLVALPMGWAWAQQFTHHYDHILSYWGNYAATYAYVAHRLMGRQIPFSMFLHAGTDLYRNQVFLQNKLIYADNIIVVCDFNRQFIAQLYPENFQLISEKIHLHHLGLDLNALHYEPENRPSNKVVAVGSLSKLKGFDFLLRAVRKLTNKGVKVTVEIVGDGEEAKSLRKLARDLNISDLISFHGWLPFKKVQEVMKHATVLVHPSIGIGDAVPTVIKEAMALGTPVIASDVAGIPELLDNGRCGILVPSQNVHALSDALFKLLSDEKLRLNYAATARKYAEQKFNLWQNGRRLANLLQSSKRHS